MAVCFWAPIAAIPTERSPLFYAGPYDWPHINLAGFFGRQSTIGQIMDRSLHINRGRVEILTVSSHHGVTFTEQVRTRHRLGKLSRSGGIGRCGVRNCRRD